MSQDQPKPFDPDQPSPQDANLVPDDEAIASSDPSADPSVDPATTDDDLAADDLSTDNLSTDSLSTTDQPIASENEATSSDAIEVEAIPDTLSDGIAEILDNAEQMATSVNSVDTTAEITDVPVAESESLDVTSAAEDERQDSATLDEPVEPSEVPEASLDASLSESLSAEDEQNVTQDVTDAGDSNDAGEIAELASEEIVEPKADEDGFDDDEFDDNSEDHESNESIASPNDTSTNVSQPSPVTTEERSPQSQTSESSSGIFGVLEAVFDLIESALPFIRAIAVLLLRAIITLMQGVLSLLEGKRTRQPQSATSPTTTPSNPSAPTPSVELSSSSTLETNAESGDGLDTTDLESPSTDDSGIDPSIDTVNNSDVDIKPAQQSDFSREDSSPSLQNQPASQPTASSTSAPTRSQTGNITVIRALFGVVASVWGGFLSVLKFVLPKKWTAPIPDKLFGVLVAIALGGLLWGYLNLRSPQPVISAPPILSDEITEQQDSETPADQSTEETQLQESQDELTSTDLENLESEDDLIADIIPELTPEDLPPPLLNLPPAQALINSLREQVQSITDQYSPDLIDTVQADFRRGRLIVMLSNDWYSLDSDRQTQVAQDILGRSRELNFSKLELVDANDRLLARSPVLGDQMLILSQ